jgi:predicted DNA-binding transcriptional regulator YafY
MNAQTRRIFTLDRWLRQGRRVVAKAAAQELGVDQRTIRRDLKEVMTRQWNLPVQYDRSQRVWYYTGDATALPGTIVSAVDRLALLLSLRSVEQYRGTPLYGQLKALYARLLELLMPESRTSYETLAAKVRFEGPPLSPIADGVWTTILNSLETAETITMTYRSGHSGQVRKRSVDPYGLVARHREWFLVGWDHYRRSVRTFFLPRIHAAQYTEKAFRVRGGFDLDAYLATAIDSHQSTGPVHRVKLRFAADATALGEEYVSNATQKMSRDEKGRVIVEFETGALYAVERDVLAWGGVVQVISPAQLCASVHGKVVSLQQLHSGGPAGP